MLEQHNPYKPMKAALVEEQPQQRDFGYWRYDTLLVVMPDSELPHRCVKCNEPAQPKSKPQKLYWHSPWIYLLVMFNAIIYILVALVVRKKIEVRLALCQRHINRRRLFILMGWLGVLAGFTVAMMLAQVAAVWSFLGVVVAVVFAVFGIIKSRVLWINKMDGSFGYLKGCGNEFLSQLPDFAERHYAVMRKWGSAG